MSGGAVPLPIAEGGSAGHGAETQRGSVQKYEARWALAARKGRLARFPLTHVGVAVPVSGYNQPPPSILLGLDG